MGTFLESNVKYVLPEMCLFRTSKTMMEGGLEHLFIFYSISRKS